MFNAFFGKSADPVIAGVNAPNTYLVKREKNAEQQQQQQQKLAFGVNLGIDGKPLRAQLGEIGRRVVTTNEKYRTEIDKHKKVLAVNKQLSQAYVQSLYAIVDVSRLLNDYASFFALLTSELDKTDAQLGSLQTSDVRHLELLTRARMSEFQKRFGQETEAIKALYLKQGSKSQAETIEAARKALDSAIMETDAAYKVLTAEPPKPPATIVGGKKKVGRRLNDKKKPVSG